MSAVIARDGAAGTIGCDELQSLIQGQAPCAVFDVRDAGEYETGHIPGATSLARRDIEFRARDLVPVRTTPIVLYDADDGRAALAARTLAGLGYADVRRLAGGLAAWRAAGRPVESGVNVPSKRFGERVLVEDGVPEVTCEALAALKARDEDLLLLDVRTPEEHRRACIPGAVNVPNGDLVLLADDLRRSPDRTVVTHCAGRTRSLIGARTLQLLGVRKTYALRNGTMGWQLAGMDLERRADRAAPAPSPASRQAAERLAAELQSSAGIVAIDAGQLAALPAEAGRTVYVFDIRSPEEFAAGHVPGAYSVPGGQAVQRADDFVAVRSSTIVFVCDRQARATVTAMWFRRMGFHDVRVLDGGTAAWVEAGRPIASGPPASAVVGLDEARATIATISPRRLSARLAHEFPLVLDVGTSFQHETRHVPGARWVSRGSLELVIGSVAPEPARPIVVTCPRGDHSTLAAAALVGLGYTAVAVLEGGVRAWTEAGLPVATGIEAPLVPPRDVALVGLARGDRQAMLRYLDWEVALVPHGEPRRS